MGVCCCKIKDKRNQNSDDQYGNHPLGTEVRTINLETQQLSSARNRMILPIRPIAKKDKNVRRNGRENALKGKPDQRRPSQKIKKSKLSPDLQIRPKLSKREKPAKKRIQPKRGPVRRNRGHTERVGGIKVVSVSEFPKLLKERRRRGSLQGSNTSEVLERKERSLMKEGAIQKPSSLSKYLKHNKKSHFGRKGEEKVGAEISKKEEAPRKILGVGRRVGAKEKKEEYLAVKKERKNRLPSIDLPKKKLRVRARKNQYGRSEGHLRVEKKVQNSSENPRNSPNTLRPDESPDPKMSQFSPRNPRSQHRLYQDPSLSPITRPIHTEKPKTDQKPTKNEIQKNSPKNSTPPSSSSSDDSIQHLSPAESHNESPSPQKEAEMTLKGVIDKLNEIEDGEQLVAVKVGEYDTDLEESQKYLYSQKRNQEKDKRVQKLLNISPISRANHKRKVTLVKPLIQPSEVTSKDERMEIKSEFDFTKGVKVRSRGLSSQDLRSEAVLGTGSIDVVIKEPSLSSNNVPVSIPVAGAALSQNINIEDIFSTLPAPQSYEHRNEVGATENQVYSTLYDLRGFVGPGAAVRRNHLIRAQTKTFGLNNDQNQNGYANFIPNESGQGTRGFLNKTVYKLPQKSPIGLEDRDSDYRGQAGIVSSIRETSMLRNLNRVSILDQTNQAFGTRTLGSRNVLEAMSRYQEDYNDNQDNKDLKNTPQVDLLRKSSQSEKIRHSDSPSPTSSLGRRHRRQNRRASSEDSSSSILDSDDSANSKAWSKSAKYTIIQEYEQQLSLKEKAGSFTFKQGKSGVSGNYSSIQYKPSDLGSGVLPKQLKVVTFMASNTQNNQTFDDDPQSPVKSQSILSKGFELDMEGSRFSNSIKANRAKSSAPKRNVGGKIEKAGGIKKMIENLKRKQRFRLDSDSLMRNQSYNDWGKAGEVEDGVAADSG